MKKLNRKTFWIFCLLVLSVLTIYLAVPNRLGQTQESLESVESPGAVFTVTTTADSGAGSFRQAITDANASAGTDTIQFQIGTGAVDINLTSALPDITEAVIIDGSTQPGFSGTPLINIVGGFGGGLKITGGGSTVKAIAITSSTLSLTLENAGGNVITGCFIGICPQDSTASCGNFVNGIQINNSPNNMIGGSTTAERNIISGNNNNGIEINGAASTGNIITGNYIGLRADGTVARNFDSGIAIMGAPNNRVGGTTAGERNVISGNGQGSDLPQIQFKSAVLISGAGASGNVVEGNYIGTTIDGTAVISGGNRLNGVRIENAPNNRIGGSVGTTPGGACTGACNVISGILFRGGVFITGSGATGNLVLGNFIGTNAAGTNNLINNIGVTITAGASNNTVGGTTASSRNLITNGMVLSAGAAMNTVQGNYIGTDTTGNVRIGTLSGGNLGAVIINSAPNNTIGTAPGTTLGGACTGGCNLISNVFHGVLITGAGSMGNRVDYNYIGLNAAGTAALRNGGDAITLLNGANNNTIGRPLTTPTPFQEIKQVESVQLNNNNICVQDDSSGDYITFKLSSDFRTATYTAVHAKSGESTSGTVDAGLSQPAIALWGNGMGVFVELATGKASGNIRFPPPSDLLLILRDTNVGDSTCVRQVADNGMQTIVGTITNGINNDPNPPNNNKFNFFSLGYSADQRSRLASPLADGNLGNLAGSFNTYSNLKVAASGSNFPPLSNRSGTDVFWGSRFFMEQYLSGGFKNLPFDNHDDGIINLPVPNPGPGANRSQNSPQDLHIRHEGGDNVRLTAVFNSTQNKRFQIRVYLNFFGHTEDTLDYHSTEEVTSFEVMTDVNGNVVINKLYTGVDAFLLKSADSLSATATLINEVPITSDNGKTSFVDVFGDTSEMSLPAAVPKPQFDFDNDGKTDFAVYRAGAAQNDLSYWYILNSSDFTFRIVQFGNGGDKPVAADYQGDGVTDFAVFRPSNATFYHSRLTGNPSTDFVGIPWGFSTDIPVVGDYDGDGATDAAVFRPSDRVWYVRRSIDGSLLTNQFGLATDKLVPADYNGDGQTDFAIYRNGEWWTSPCAGCPASVINFGLATDDPVPGVDFNGDGADDIAVTRNDGASKFWHWLESGTGAYRVVQFGLATDKVLVGDFDADGKSDLAVFRPSEGNWYVFGSEQGFFVLRWGTSTDIPIPSAHLP